MKIHACRQGTTEWLELRSGIPTSSAFDKIITRGGKPSKSAEPYMYALLAERLMGHPIVEHMSLWMERGSELEKDARHFFEFQRDCEVEQVGFITNDEETIGASPDGLVNGDGCVEFKCPKEATHIAFLIQSGLAYEEYKVQVQGQLWVTGRKWVDLVSYHPELPPALIRSERDEAFIGLLSEAVTAFSRDLENLYAQLVERCHVAPTRPVRSPQDQLIEDMKKELIETGANKR